MYDDLREAANTLEAAKCLSHSTGKEVRRSCQSLSSLRMRNGRWLAAVRTIEVTRSRRQRSHRYQQYELSDGAGHKLKVYSVHTKQHR
jgi:hypothetical protein